MKNGIILLILSLAVSGCSTMGSVNKGYSKIKAEDGISKREAKVIAKKALMDSKFNGEYQLIRPQIMLTNETIRHPNYWFVQADQKKIGFNESFFLVVVDKRTGEVIYAKNHKPYRTDIKGYGWVLTMHNIDKKS